MIFVTIVEQNIILWMNGLIASFVVIQNLLYR
jgi:hypothetical protein